MYELNEICMCISIFCIGGVFFNLAFQSLKSKSRKTSKRITANLYIMDLVRNALIDKAKKCGWEIDFEKPVKLEADNKDSYLISFHTFGKGKRMFVIRDFEIEIADKMRANLGAKNGPKNCKSIW